MIAIVWVVTKTPEGFLARKHKQGHDGMKMLVPGFTGDSVERSTLEALRIALEAENVRVSLSERITDAFRVGVDTSIIEVWY